MSAFGFAANSYPKMFRQIEEAAPPRRAVVFITGTAPRTGPLVRKEAVEPWFQIPAARTARSVLSARNPLRISGSCSTKRGSGPESERG